MLALETRRAPKQGRQKRQKMRCSASEADGMRRSSHTAEGRFGSFEIVTYAPLRRKRSVPSPGLLPDRNASAGGPALNANSNARLVPSSGPSGLSPAALEILANPKLRASPYQPRAGPYRERPPAPERVGKVFLSERQSRTLSESGASFPGAPPTTPTPMVLQRTEYVPSMTDIRAQRSLSERLQGMRNVQKARAEKMRRDAERSERTAEAERLKEEKRQQRRVIYALNELMTRAENERFEEYIRRNGFGA